MYLCMISSSCLDVLYTFVHSVFPVYSVPILQTPMGGEGGLYLILCPVFSLHRKGPCTITLDRYDGLLLPTFQHKHFGVKNCTMILFCHCPVFVSNIVSLNDDSLFTFLVCLFYSMYV